MVKGVSKTIIEINNTGNECFEKILLFVNANCNNNGVIKDEVNAIARTLSGEYLPPSLRRREKKRKRIIAGLTACFAALAALCIYLIVK